MNPKLNEQSSQVKFLEAVEEAVKDYASAVDVIAVAGQQRATVVLAVARARGRSDQGPVRIG